MNERRLATVLRVRALQERIARSEVARRRLVLDGERHAESTAWRDVRVRSAIAPHEASRFVSHRRMLEGGVVDASRAAARTAAALTDVESAVATWHVEARRLDGIERLADRVRIAAATEEQRRDGNEIDDLVVMRHRSPR